MGKNDRPDERGEQAEEEELKVTDRRLFTSDGSPRHDLEEEDEPEPVEETKAPTDERTERSGPGDVPGFERRSLDEPHGVDFTMLINAMAQPALIFLGEVAHPGTGREEINLEQARLQIDLLDILRIKSRGNLTSEEEALLDRVLYELRMRYVARSNQSKD
jgi:hypothetical protein